MTTSDPHRGTQHNFQTWVRGRVTQRGAFPTLAITTLTLAVAFGVLANTIADDDFESYGDAIWWSLTTLTTVGYGDVVPTSAIGRIIGVCVMVMGVTFLSFLTATVTSLFVSADEEGHAEQRRRDFSELITALRSIDERLSGIEARLDGRG